jgi:hypothetical protein
VLFGRWCPDRWNAVFLSPETTEAPAPTTATPSAQDNCHY